MSLKTAAVLIASMSMMLGSVPSTLCAEEPGAQAGLDHLRAALKEAYNRGDVDAMARYLHPEAVIIFPDGSVLKGRDAFREYYNRMLKGPGHRVVSYSADPVVVSRTVHNDVGLSYGFMHDRYVLNDGKSFGLDSRFTATVFKSPGGPADSDGWMIRSFHSSADAFDNPVLSMVARGVLVRAGGGGLALGLLLGVALGAFLGRRRQKPAVR
jgi:ketosteroid isomerase-like protein